MIYEYFFQLAHRLHAENSCEIYKIISVFDMLRQNERLEKRSNQELLLECTIKATDFHRFKQKIFFSILNHCNNANLFSEDKTHFWNECGLPLSPKVVGKGLLLYSVTPVSQLMAKWRLSSLPPVEEEKRGTAPPMPAAPMSSSASPLPSSECRLSSWGRCG